MRNHSPCILQELNPLLDSEAHDVSLWEWKLGRVAFLWRGLPTPQSKGGCSLLTIVTQRLILTDHPDETRK